MCTKKFLCPCTRCGVTKVLWALALLAALCLVGVLTGCTSISTNHRFPQTACIHYKPSGTMSDTYERIVVYGFNEDSQKWVVVFQDRGDRTPQEVDKDIVTFQCPDTEAYGGMWFDSAERRFP